jgi:5-methylcytosine-specific restriction endonuclease McrA
MPIDYKKYVFDWKSRVRPDIIRRANNHCELCGIKNYTLVRVFRSGIRQFISEYFTAKDANSVCSYLNKNIDRKISKHIVVVLTVAHLDHDIKNNDYQNLKALCQKCHNRHDVKDRVKNRKSNQPKP